MRQSQTNRAVGAHDMNEHSSRSHSILTLTCRGRNLRDGSTTYGNFYSILYLFISLKTKSLNNLINE